MTRTQRGAAPSRSPHRVNCTHPVTRLARRLLVRFASWYSEVIMLGPRLPARTRSLRRSRSAVALAPLALAGLAATAVLASPRDAEASGYLAGRFGSDYGTPAVANTYAIYFNPAALGGTKGTTITGDLSLTLRWASYKRSDDALSPQTSDRNDPNYVAANTGKANLLNLLALPFAGVNTDFGTDWLRGGFAVYVPFGGLATWDKQSTVGNTPGSVDGPARWHNISGQILAVYNTFAVAAKVGHGLSVGASVSPVIHHVATIRARNVNGSDDTFNKQGGLEEGRSYLEATGVNLAASFGVYYEPTEKLRFGLAYLSQPGFGDTRISGTLRAQSGAQSETNDPIDFIQTYPDIVRFGTNAILNEKWDLKADFEFVRWNVFKRQCIVKKGQPCDVADDGRDLSNGKVILNIPRNWNNAIGVRVGPGYKLTEHTELFGSLGITTPAVPKETIDASTIDAFRVYATAGARFELSQHVAVGVSYNHIYFATVDTKGANNQDLQNQPGGDYNVSRSPSADGTYKSQIGMVNANFAYTF
jgi:long-chain fatty acid transport protein